MNPFALVPLASALACLAFGLLLAAREWHTPAYRCLSLVLLGGAVWGLCEAFWTVAPTSGSALWLVRASTPGWALVGPVVLHAFVCSSSAPPRWSRRALAASYTVTVALCLVSWLTPWMHTGVSPQSWGWSYRVGPAFAVWYGLTLATIAAGIVVGVRELRVWDSPAHVSQRPWFVVALALPLGIGSVTDGLLPLLSIEAPRAGVVSFAVFGALICWNLGRYGYSLAAPGSVAGRILSELPEGVALVTPDGHIRYANEGLARLVGMDVAALPGQALSRFLPSAALDARDAAGEDGEVDLDLGPRGRTPVAVSSSQVRDGRGLLIGTIFLVRDLSEIRALRARLATSARLAAVGQLAAGIAHEINNPLAFIGSNLRVLCDQLQRMAEMHRTQDGKVDFEHAFDESVQILTESLEGVDHAAEIVRDVHAFSHDAGPERGLLDVNELCDRALRIAAPQLRRSARVVRELGAVECVVGSRRELQQVLLNLLVNAGQAIDQVGTVSLRTRMRDGLVEVAVVDTGRGITPDELERIFDPFFTTKAVGEGSGLGLSISHEIVRRHGGLLAVESRPGDGTTFRVLLPQAGDEG